MPKRRKNLKPKSVIKRIKAGIGDLFKRVRDRVNQRSFNVLLVAVLTLIAVRACGALADPYNKMAQSVVKLTKINERGGGTGFLTRGKSGKPVIVTNWHVCSLGAEMNASRDREFQEIIVKTLEADPIHDLCIMEGVPGVPLPIGDSPNRFDSVYILGHPLLRNLTPSQGHFSAEVKEKIMFGLNSDGSCPPSAELYIGFNGIGCIMELELQDTTALIAPGNSGSPVTDVAGNVIGVINSSNSRGQGSMIPLRHLKKLLEKY